MIYYSLTQKNHPAHDALSNKTACKVIGFPKMNVWEIADNKVDN